MLQANAAPSQQFLVRVTRFVHTSVSSGVFSSKAVCVLQTFSAVHSADEQHASAANLHIMPEEQPPAKRAYKRYCHPWSVAPQVAVPQSLQCSLS